MFRNISHPIFLWICIPNVGLKSHNPAPYVFFSKSRLTPPPLPPVSHLHTYPLFSISPSFFRSGLRNPSYPTIRYNTPNRVYLSWLTPPLTSIMFIINCTCTPPYPYLYLLPPLTPYIHLFLHLRLFSICLNVKWNQDEWTLHNLREVPQQSGGSYSRKAIRMKTGNR